jgi:probable rRNA maturation factor
MSASEPPLASEDPLVAFVRTPAGIDRDRIEQFARTLRERVAAGKSFACRVTGDAELRRLNQAYLGHDCATDVLSFPCRDGDFLGDLAISRQRAAEQAERFGHDVHQEIEILMLHGLLHLTGLDHETDDGRMARAEARWRRQLGLPGGLIERSRA